VLQGTTDPPDAVLRYADRDEALVDVHLPPQPTQPADAAPLVVLFHGGFWREHWDRTHTRALAGALAGAGFVVATPEYRRVGGTGGWPTTFEDVSAVMEGLPELLAGIGVRTGRVTLLGHSAGGQLALWLANQPHEVDRVVALAPVADLRAAAAQHLDDDAVQDLLGGGPDEVPERYDASDPMTRMATPPACEVVVVHGTDDANVPVSLSRALADRHPYVTLFELAGTEHFALINPRSNAWPVVLAAVSGMPVDLG
jgi:acetyl esterase/lipase